MNRAVALLGKELADLRQNPTLFLPSLIVAALAILLPLFVAMIVPYVSGERLSDSSDLEVAIGDVSPEPGDARARSPRRRSRRISSSTFS